MIHHGAVWALGIPSLAEMLVVAVVTLVLYGRSGRIPTGHARSLLPWLSPFRRTARAPARPEQSQRQERYLFWFLAITAATAVAAWIVTRALIVGAPGASH